MSACACKLVFRDQGWLVLHYEEEGELEDLRMSQRCSHFLKILYNTASVLSTVDFLTIL